MHIYIIRYSSSMCMSAGSLAQFSLNLIKTINNLSCSASRVIRRFISRTDFDYIALWLTRFPTSLKNRKKKNRDVEKDGIWTPAKMTVSAPIVPIPPSLSKKFTGTFWGASKKYFQLQSAAQLVKIAHYCGTFRSVAVRALPFRPYRSYSQNNGIFW